MPQPMNTWSDLPTEILNLITVYCGRNSRKVKWMFVNKRWFTFYLSKAYFTIETSLNNEHVVTKILYSPFDIGKHIKQINLSNIQKPKDLNALDLHSDLLGKIMKQTPNVREVNLFRDTNGSDRRKSCENCTSQDWSYFSVILINNSCWNLQFLPALGEDNVASAACYYACAYHSRRSLKNLELSIGMIGSKDFSCLINFTSLESLEVHKNMISGLNDLKSLIQFTPNIHQLIVRFATNRIYKPLKVQYVTCPNIKKLWLYNFTPRHSFELLTLERELSSLQNLYIFCERDRRWLGKVEDPFVIEHFFKSINSIPKYEIMMSGDAQAIGFSKPWLKSIKRQDLHLLLSYYEHNNQNYLSYKSNIVATFHGGSAQSVPALKYAMMSMDSIQEISDSLSVLDSQSFSVLRIFGIVLDLSILLKQIAAKERTYLKKLFIFNSLFEAYPIPQADTALVPQHMNSIIFHSCKIDFLSLKSFLNEFEYLDCIEFDNCMFGGNPNKESIDLSDTDITLMNMISFRKMSLGRIYSNTVQTIIAISIYFVTQDVTRYFSIVDDNLMEGTKRTFEVLRSNFKSDDVVVLNIKVKTLQKLSLKLTRTSKIFDLTF